MNTARLVKYVRPFFNNMNERVKGLVGARVHSVSKQFSRETHLVQSQETSIYGMLCPMLFKLTVKTSKIASLL